MYMENNKDSYTVLPLFSKPLYVSNCEPDDDLKIVLYKFIKNSNLKWTLDLKKNLLTNCRTLNLHVLEELELKPLKKMILERFNFFKNNVLKYTENEFKLTTSWITSTKKHFYSEYHNHSHSMYTGVLYFNQSPDQGGTSLINFEKQTFKPSVSEKNLYNSTEWIIDPKPWQIIFFPSEVYHKVMQNNNKKVRHTLAFNFYPIGYLGEGDSCIKLL